MKSAIQERLREILPLEELPLFFSAIEELVAKPRKSLRVSSRNRLSATELSAHGVSLEGEVPWAKGFGHFFRKESLPDPAHHPLIASGLVYIQEASAMEVVEMLDVRPGMHVLDLCAAPGGKSTQILDRLLGQGFLVANEVNRERVKKLDAMLARWGYLNLAVLSMDGAQMESAFPQHFDRVLVDAPCSSESFFAKRNDHRADVSERESLQFQRLQIGLLSNGFQMLKEGGRLVYSTCTYSRLENEEVLASLVNVFGDAVKILSEQRRWPHRDRVPGGYLAVVEKRLVNGFESNLRLNSLAGREEWAKKMDGIREKVRVEAQGWNGEPNAYALVMAGEKSPDLFSRDIVLTTPEATEFLKRQWSGDQSKDRLRVLWNEFPIGLFQYGKGIRSYIFPQNL
jgi:16S rRNA C967 or C1407 C5-methylase (RsmB/RsmF family)